MWSCYHPSSRPFHLHSLLSRRSSLRAPDLLDTRDPGPDLLCPGHQGQPGERRDLFPRAPVILILDPRCLGHPGHDPPCRGLQGLRQLRTSLLSRPEWTGWSPTYIPLGINSLTTDTGLLGDRPRPSRERLALRYRHVRLPLDSVLLVGGLSPQPGADDLTLLMTVAPLRTAGPARILQTGPAHSLALVHSGQLLLHRPDESRKPTWTLGRLSSTLALFSPVNRKPLPPLQSRGQGC